VQLVHILILEKIFKNFFARFGGIIFSVIGVANSVLAIVFAQNRLTLFILPYLTDARVCR
jgi:hypothetical protein